MYLFSHKTNQIQYLSFRITCKYSTQKYTGRWSHQREGMHAIHAVMLVKSCLTCLGPNTAPMLSFMLLLPLVQSTVLRFPWPTWFVQVIRTPVEMMQYDCSTCIIFAYSWKHTMHRQRTAGWECKICCSWINGERENSARFRERPWLYNRTQTYYDLSPS